MHYIKHRLSSGTNDQWARPVRQKLSYVSSVQFIYVALYAP